MTVTLRTARAVRRGLYGVLAGGLLSAAASLVIAVPLIHSNRAIPPWVKPRPKLFSRTWLARHPDVRQHLIDLANKCTS